MCQSNECLLSGKMYNWHIIICCHRVPYRLILNYEATTFYTDRCKAQNDLGVAGTTGHRKFYKF